MSSSQGKLKPSSSELDLDRPNIEDYLPSGASIQEPHGKLRLCDLLDISPILTEAAGAIVDGSSFDNRMDNISFMLHSYALTSQRERCIAEKVGEGLGGTNLQLLCCFLDWSGVCRQSYFYDRFHHIRTDDCICCHYAKASWMGWTATKNYFRECRLYLVNRSEAKDREIVAKKLRDHSQGADNNPLLIFPEGTCVNNQYSVMFKKGAFELGCTVCPIAIKYNTNFVDAFWNSRKQSFTMHLLQLMTSWAVVCDVWYLEPQNLRPGETLIEFAERVRDIISVRAGLKKVPWDGYLKYSRPSPKHRERKQQSFAESVLRRLEEK
ncbi:lysM domain-containing GPI-anchored protein 2 [Hibiscus syriacus]|uniref:LysM domain-containing GPI-anchored protein 2 n=1 Tax=Hibiscus syriacus TaxID=106335 RepID=A0A6A2X7J3_HIBSY|nr:lysM domain-containing GPI-anchored protein 2 [Hibiscus syriacus]